MRFENLRFAPALLLILPCITQCKPKKSNLSGLQSITGTDEAGREVALALVPVRNFTIAALDKGSKDPGVKQAAAMVRARLFAVVECVSVVGSKGDRIDAATLMSAVEARAAIDDLYVDKDRQLLTSFDDGKLAAFGSKANKLVKVPCQIHGRRMLSWDVLADIEVRAAGIPKNPPADDRAIEDVYRLAQAMHLSLRGSYSKTNVNAFMPRVPAIMDMLYEQAGLMPTSPALVSRIQAADSVYNVCSDAAVTDPDAPNVSAFKGASYGCSPHPSDAGFFVYRVGAGKGGETYTQVKDRISLAIEGTHKIVFAAKGSDPVLFDLWDNLTSTGTMDGKIGTYLTTGSGVDFAKVFASGDSKAVAATNAAPKRMNSTKLVAPLALGISSAKDRTRPILRATADTKADLPLLEGGTRSTALKRASSAKGRIDMLGKYMGSGGKTELAELATKVTNAMVTLRKPK